MDVFFLFHLDELNELFNEPLVETILVEEAPIKEFFFKRDIGVHILDENRQNGVILASTPILMPLSNVYYFLRENKVFQGVSK